MDPRRERSPPPPTSINHSFIGWVYLIERSLSIDPYEYVNTHNRVFFVQVPLLYSIAENMRSHCFPLILLLCVHIFTAYAGHEVLHGIRVDPILDIQPHELAIVQFDTRPLGNYWNISAHWNHAYAMKHGHQYAFITLKSGHNQDCKRNGIVLSPAWCKVKAMLRAHRFLPTAKAFLYIDSDAVITTQFDHSFTDVLSYIRKDLHWNTTQMPIAFNQDGPGWACNNVVESTGYDFCLNSGTVYWRRSFISQKVLSDWWKMSADPYSAHRFSQQWRRVWPWEQAPQHKVFDQYRYFIMRLSFPELIHLPWVRTYIYCIYIYAYYTMLCYAMLWYAVV